MLCYNVNQVQLSVMLTCLDDLVAGYYFFYSNQSSYGQITGGRMDVYR